MKTLTKEEFHARLEEDKFFLDPEELINYRIPVVQYFLTNHPVQIVTNIGTFDTSKIELQRSHSAQELSMISWAYKCIRNTFINKK